MKTSTKLGLLSSLYLSQRLPYGFFTQALLALPWALKFLCMEGTSFWPR